MQIFCVFFAFFSPFLTGFIRQNSLSLGHTTRKIEFCPFFESVKFCALLSFFCSLFCFFFDDQKEEKRVKKKFLFFDTLPSHEREKEEKNSSHYYEGRSAFSEALV